MSGTAEPARRPAGPDRIDLEVGEWRRVSPKYVVVVLVGALVSGIVLAAAATFLWLVAGWTFGWILLAVVAIGTIVSLVIAPRRARSIGYVLREDDLLFRRGIMFQRFVSVPYGRMQLIDITRGPVGRMLGLADLKFVTAAASTGVLIPGLPDAEAAELRDRLVTLAESRRAGL
ncbi:PH domain-containing protein [Leifsonia sp. F6_8S_P_1B]|uniref:PH domain-containing protein n=1 Tax=Leifsonia williamsii TaxID=3035919 RepID=A0ABT8KFY4_9MICO|nr:PH domain-containing protein [Leifsonia williamsii]MDN4616371.1 PH domain-containing protein [Leifsonia williamsii]